MLLLAALAAGGCSFLLPLPAPVAPYDQFPLERFRKVDEGLYSGAHPSPAQLRELVARYHIKTVIKLNPDWQGTDVWLPGVTISNHPIPAVFIPTEAEIDRILDELEHAPRPIFIHCRTGADRVGMIVALYRVRHGASPAAAREEMLKYGYRPYRGVERAWFRGVAKFAPADAQR